MARTDASVEDGSLAAAPTRASAAALARALLRSLRPRHWTKNLLIFLALAFSAGQAWSFDDLAHLGSLLRTATVAFALFCGLAGAVYLLNDIQDAAADRVHPTKRWRPVAAGTVPLLAAWAALIVLGAACLTLSYRLGVEFGVVASLYVAVHILYSYWLKHLVLIDAFAIAAGFVLRAVAGALAIDVEISEWLYLCTFLGALFIAFVKRRQEMALLEAGGILHRPILAHYSPQLIDHIIALLASAALIAYCLYTFSAEGRPENRAMMLTIPFVAYGILRYLYLVHQKGLGDSPELVLVTDLPLAITIVLWVATAVTVLVVLR